MQQVKEGIVVSNKMIKTVVVKSKKFKARDERGVKLGQKVKIAEVKPFAKDVRFKVLEGAADGSN